MKENNFDKAIDKALDEALIHPADSPEFAAISNNLNALAEAKRKYTSNGVDKNQLIAAAASIFGIVIIGTLEYTQPLVSKAFGFLIRPKQL